MDRMSEDMVYDPSTIKTTMSISPRSGDEEDNHYSESDIRHTATSGQRHARVIDPKKALLGLGFALVSIVLVIYVAVVLSSGDGENSSSSPNHALLPNPPSDLTSKCSEEFIATTDGEVACMEVCEPAECCDFPTNMPLSCLPGNEGRCLEYHTSCVVLSGTPADENPDDVPAAPDNLDQLCEPNSLATVDGFMGCHQACHRAECCYEDNVPRCTADPDCASYAPCLNLAATDHEHESIPQLLEEFCSDTKLQTLEGRQGCHQVCSNALCCFAASDSGKDCQHHDTSFCYQYDKCNELHMTDQQIIASPSEIQQACDSQRGVAEHKSYCELVCQEGSCCFSDNEDCPSNVSCDGYTPCQDIFNNPVEPPKAATKDEVDEACNSEIETVGVPGLDLCQDVCEPGSCCFQSEECTDNTIDCDMYESCAKLYSEGSDGSGGGDGSGGTPSNKPVTKEDIRHACFGESDLTQCNELCEAGRCCFDNENECSDSSLQCNDYFDCYVVFREGGRPSTPNKKEQIEQACGTGGDEPVDEAHCTELCQDGLCCFDENNCDTPASVDCIDYVPCVVVLPSAEHEVTKEDVRNACFGNDESLCQDICEPAACCFESNNEGCNIECNTYFDCGVLYRGEA